MNIVTHPVHTGYQYDLAGTGHQFYSVPIRGTGEVFWDETSRPKPENFHMLEAVSEAPVKFDLALVHFKQGFELFRSLDIPIIYKEHCLRPPLYVSPRWHRRVSYYSFSNALAAGRWNLPKDKERRKIIIGMGIDTNVYQGYHGSGGDVLMVSHRVALRPLKKGLSHVKSLNEEFALTLVGNNNEGIKGAIGPARNFEELLEHYRSFKVFLNCSYILGMSTLEAMGMGMPVVTFKTINSRIVENKVTGLVVDSVPEARAALRELLANREFALQLGRNARECIRERFSPANFRNRWNTLFYRAAYEHAKNSCPDRLPG